MHRRWCFCELRRDCLQSLAAGTAGFSKLLPSTPRHDTFGGEASPGVRRKSDAWQQTGGVHFSEHPRGLGVRCPAEARPRIVRRLRIAVAESSYVDDAPPRPARADEVRTAGGGGDVTVIRPRPGWQAVDLRELWQYRELLFFLIWRDIKVRYKQTVLGAAWAILQPVTSMVIFSIIFGRFAKIPSDGVAYPIFVYAGLLPWIFFEKAVSQSAVSLVTQSNLLTKIYFPRLFVPAASVGAMLVDFALSFVVYVFIMLWYMHLPGLLILLFPGLLLLTVVTAVGAGCLLASLTVSYRDFRLVVPFMLQIWLYCSPVVYPVSLFPERYQWILALNPLTGIIGGFRSALLNQPMDWLLLGVSSVVALGLFFFGLLNFRRTERRFADVA